MNYYLKDPGATLDYSFDWSAGYLVGQTIGASFWEVVPAEPGGVVLVSSASTPAATSARLGGGLAGHVYRITNQVTFSDGESDERSIELRVEDR